jgi:hypothetical protein
LSFEILSATCSSLLEWPSTVVFFLDYRDFYFQDFCLILSSEVFHIFVQLLLYILCCPLWCISLFIVPFVCRGPLWVPLFVSVSSHVLHYWCLKISWVHLVHSG